VSAANYKSGTTAELCFEEIVMAPVGPYRRSIATAALILLTSLPAPAEPLRRHAATTPVNEWTKYCGNLSMSGVAAGEKILSTESVPRMALLWSRKLNGPIASEPSIARGNIYVGDWGGYEWALDTDTGEINAFANLGITTNQHCNPPAMGITSSPLIDGNRVYLAGGDDGFYALDADTLTTVWRRSLGDNTADGGYYGWCSPTLAGGKLIQGISSNCDDPFPRGGLAAIDPATGEVSTITYFVPETNVGGGVWTSAAIDTDHRKIFVTTGSADFFGDGNAYSIVRLDLDTFQIEDAWQLPPTDDARMDADWGSSPTLFTDAGGRELVGAGQKDGGYYCFDRNNLAAGPIWVAPIAVGGDVPQVGQGTLSTAAFDGTTLYIGGGASPDSDDPTQIGSLCAVRPDDGTILWRHTFDGPVIAPVSFANGVVFAVGGQSIVAFDAATGAVLWSFKMKAAGFGGVAIANGRAYVGDLSGTIYAFGLPGPLGARRPGRR
jgi:outer membrane protein assembly factor BamB